MRQSLLTHMARNKGKQNRQPLVLVFAGPSEHGKTELARKLVDLLSLDTEVVDCTAFSRDTELFGPRPGYVDANKGSRLNNLLSCHDGKRCIEFLHEFEKTSKEIHDTLLKPFDEGMWTSSRNVQITRSISVITPNVACYFLVDLLIKQLYAGLYQDRTNTAEVDASQVIWVLATNVTDKHSMNFCDANSADLFNEMIFQIGLG